MVPSQEQGGGEVAQLGADIRALEDQAREGHLFTEFDQLQQSASDRISKRLQQLRARGYAFAGDLEGALHDTSTQLDAARRPLTEQARRTCEDLARRLRRLRDEVRYLEGEPDSGRALLVASRRGDLDDARRDLARVQDTIRDAIGAAPARLQEVEGRIVQAEAYLERAGGLCLPLAADESIYLAVDAEWKKGQSAKENPDGILVVTDRRVIMERREKEGGFLGFGGRRVQELAWELPLDKIQQIRPEQRGLMGGVDLIHLTGPDGEITIEVKGGLDADAFATQVRRALDGSIERERADRR